ncbi:F-box protein PP2-B10-like [Solanum dulcamara]|uniref:F-box protein PP2-B10-like n=1 Tax=Solanum dulcamara TaxID=45834 RepID=UPI002485707E|nr:F-box protein PP2-B10-like [Solanum dulcamara]
MEELVELWLLAGSSVSHRWLLFVYLGSFEELLNIVGEMIDQFKVAASSSLSDKLVLVSVEEFSEVACLGYACWLNICGRIGTKVLSPNTYYVAYLVFKLVDMYHGFEPNNYTIMLVNYQREIATKEQINTVRQINTMRIATFPKLRRDGWMEIELGNFNSKESSDGPVVERLIKIQRFDYKPSGLIVEGIEFRPKTIE